MVSFLKISENHEKFVEKVDFYSSISLSGSGFRIRIRIQSGNLNPDPPGSETLHVIYLRNLLTANSNVSDTDLIVKLKGKKNDG